MTNGVGGRVGTGSGRFVGNRVGSDGVGTGDESKILNENVVSFSQSNPPPTGAAKTINSVVYSPSAQISMRSVSEL